MIYTQEQLGCKKLFGKYPTMVKSAKKRWKVDIITLKKVNSFKDPGTKIKLR